jgi:hypothetical protein
MCREHFSPNFLARCHDFEKPARSNKPPSARFFDNYYAISSKLLPVGSTACAESKPMASQTILSACDPNDGLSISGAVQDPADRHR